MSGYEVLLMKGNEPVATFVLARLDGGPIRVPRIKPITIRGYSKYEPFDTSGVEVDEYEVVRPSTATRYLVAQYRRTVQP